MRRGVTGNTTYLVFFFLNDCWGFSVDKQISYTIVRFYWYTQLRYEISAEKGRIR